MPRKQGRRGVHTAVVLPPEMLEALRKSEGGISDEIRRRLTLTFEQDAADPVTRELQQAVADLADLVRQDLGAWHASRRAHAVFAEMLRQHLVGYTPPKAAGPVVAASDLLAAEIDDSPEAIAAIAEMRVRDNRRAHSYPHLSKMQTRRLAPVLRRKS